MSRNSEHDQASSTEPVGIIISRGLRGTTEGTPRFWAYVWAPAPEGDLAAPSKAA